MAGECPHNTLLETALKQCHNGPLLISNDHETYLKIIEDLKNDLEQISCDVTMVQQECSNPDHCADTDDVGLESSLKELETQNDRLEQALRQQTQTKESILKELQTNNKTLKSQIVYLENKIIERDQYINYIQKCIPHAESCDPHQAALEYVDEAVGNNFTAELQRKIKTLSEKLDKSKTQEQFLTRETRKLNEELNESKRKSRDLITQAHRLNDLLRQQEANRVELAAKYEDLEHNYEDQAKKLRAANNQLCMLEETFHIMEKRQIEYNTERNLLREEVLSLKEKQACAMGRQKSIQEQLVKTEKELYTAHDVVKEQKAIMQRNEYFHNESQRRLQTTNDELKNKFTDLIKEHKKLQQEHEKQKEINLQQLNIIESFRKWQKEQLKFEKKVHKTFKEYDDYILSLWTKNKDLLYEYHDLSKENSLLQNEMERLKVCPLSSFNTIDRWIAERSEIVRHTTHRIHEQNSSLKAEEPTTSRSDSSPAHRSDEEPL